MTLSFVDRVNEHCREAALSALVEVWRDLQAQPAGDRVITVYANSSATAVADLVVLKGRIDAVLAERGDAP